MCVKLREKHSEAECGMRKRRRTAKGAEKHGQDLHARCTHAALPPAPVCVIGARKVQVLMQLSYVCRHNLLRSNNGVDILYVCPSTILRSKTALHDTGELLRELQIRPIKAPKRMARWCN